MQEQFELPQINDNKKMSEKRLDILSAYNLQTQNDMIILNSIFASRTQALRRRRRQLLLNITLLQKKQSLLIKTLLSKRTPRKVWTKSIFSQFWEKDVLENDDEFFEEQFRMTPEIFEILCDELKNLEKENTAFRKSIPLRKRVAIALYAFGSQEEYRKIGNKFGIGKSTVCKILKNFCEEVWKVLGSAYLKKCPVKEEDNLQKNYSEIYEIYLLERDIDPSLADEKYKDVFAQLAARFRRVAKELETESTSLLIKVGCVLHNFTNWIQHQDET